MLKYVNGFFGWIVGLILLGIAILVYGSIQDSLLFSSLGGALLGASFSTFIANLSYEGFEKRIYSLISSLTGSNFKSNEKKLDYYRKKWHYYNITKKNSKLIWRHHLIDFSKETIPGSLICKFKSKELREKNRGYVYEGFYREERFVLVGKATIGEEPPVIAVFPQMGNAFQGIQAGIIFSRNYDNEESLCSALLSENAIEENAKYGWMELDKYPELKDKWSEIFDKSNKRLIFE
ncbi:MAG: hypothetical protein K8S16_18185 [Bacteroidales bacterium]|nr:hypothetical protein [Bacteroidales bacterium]